MILGVNVGSERQDLKDDAEVKPIVRGFLFNDRVARPTILNELDGADIT